MTQYYAGFSKADITCPIEGLGMMGYGQNHNRVKGVATPLWVRSCVICDEQKNYYIFSCFEQCFVSQALSERIIDLVIESFPALNLSKSNFNLTAQHTHSAPGGYSHYPLYNFSIPAFQIRVFEKLVSAGVDSIKNAIQELKKVNIYYGEYEFPLKDQVAFNRSLRAYYRNPEAHGKETSSQAVNRVMQALNFYHDEKLIGTLNFFGVHCTSISSYNTLIHHDNKGVASQLFESQNKDAIAIFAQAASGDISPNWIRDKKTNIDRGPFSDQYENARFNGELQYIGANKIKPELLVTGEIKSRASNLNMSTLAAAPAHGLAFFMGTKEGPGLSNSAALCIKIILRIVKLIKLYWGSAEDKKFYQAHGAKDILLDHRNGSFAAISLKFWKKVPRLILDPILKRFHLELKLGALKTLPWVAPIIPIRINQIGNILN